MNSRLSVVGCRLSVVTEESGEAKALKVRFAMSCTRFITDN